jgi:co-chaperonin GroES (HSP10)|tara:strand:+ start:1920 stop:2177 length:258 start_codon:yes stop_codon:yes gene_type:complete
MKALGDRVLLKKVEEEIKDSLGLIVTELTDKDVRHKRAAVVSVGEKVVGLNEGDEVLYDMAAGSSVRIKGQTYVIIPEFKIDILL